MKKLLSALFIQILVFGFVFGATINSRQGYAKISWGSTVEEAKKAGYKLSPMGTDYANKLYAVPIDAYKVTSKEKKVSALQFHYYNGSLFLVTETLSGYKLDPQELEDRYGDFNQRGIFRSGRQYTDAKFRHDGSVSSMSIAIANNSAGNVVATLYDWNIYSVVSFAGQKLANKGQSLSIGENSSIADALSDMANDLTKSVEGNKPKFAFLPLTTDYQNVLTEDYVTEALTEAVFNTKKISIVERTKLDVALNELKFQASGLVNEKTAKDIGMLAHADYVCYGTLRDLGDRITVNARVIDVESGELFAISRATVKKDDYLKQRRQSAEGERKASIVSTAKNTTSTQTATATTKNVTTMPVKTTENNAWKVRTYNDDFGGAKVYIFTINSSDSRMLFIRYQKATNPANSKVISGIHWTESNGWENNGGNYDIKGNNGMTVSKQLEGRDLRCFLNASETQYFYYAWNPKDGARWLVDIIRKSDSVAVRRDGLSRRFQTAGLLDKMTEYGITWKEIDAAIANEEF